MRHLRQRRHFCQRRHLCQRSHLCQRRHLCRRSHLCRRRHPVNVLSIQQFLSSASYLVLSVFLQQVTIYFNVHTVSSFVTIPTVYFRCVYLILCPVIYCEGLVHRLFSYADRIRIEFLIKICYFLDAQYLVVAYMRELMHSIVCMLC